MVKPKSLRKVAYKTVRVRRKKRGFEETMAQMVADSVIQAECAVITKDFRLAEADGLKQNCYED
jgi:hypothetical protein